MEPVHHPAAEAVVVVEPVHPDLEMVGKAAANVVVVVVEAVE